MRSDTLGVVVRISKFPGMHRPMDWTVGIDLTVDGLTNNPDVKQFFTQRQLHGLQWFMQPGVLPWMRIYRSSSCFVTLTVLTTSLYTLFQFLQLGGCTARTMISRERRCFESWRFLHHTLQQHGTANGSISSKQLSHHERIE